MSWWNLGGFNPKFKDFMDKHPDKTVLGVGWAFYWRFMILAFVIEALVFIFFVVVGMALALLIRH